MKTSLNKNRISLELTRKKARMRGIGSLLDISPDNTRLYQDLKKSGYAQRAGRVNRVGVYFNRATAEVADEKLLQAIKKQRIKDIAKKVQL